MYFLSIKLLKQKFYIFFKYEIVKRGGFMTDYELFPNKDLLKLRSEIDKLKSGKAPDSNLVDSMGSLTKSIETLNELFYAATEEMRAEEKSERTIIKKLDPLFDKLDQIIEQNTKIARAIVALTDMIRERPSMRAEARPRPLFRPANPPASPAPPFSPPRFPSNEEGLFK